MWVNISTRYRAESAKARIWGYIYQQKVKLLLRPSYTYSCKGEKTQRVSRACWDIASSASCVVREINFVDPSVSTEEELGFLEK